MHYFAKQCMIFKHSIKEEAGLKEGGKDRPLVGGGT
jgi:hypothetical protein